MKKRLGKLKEGKGCTVHPCFFLQKFSYIIACLLAQNHNPEVFKFKISTFLFLVFSQKLATIPQKIIFKLKYDD